MRRDEATEHLIAHDIYGLFPSVLETTGLKPAPQIKKVLVFSNRSREHIQPIIQMLLLLSKQPLAG